MRNIISRIEENTDLNKTRQYFKIIIVCWGVLREAGASLVLDWMGWDGLSQKWVVTVGMANQNSLSKPPPLPSTSARKFFAFPITAPLLPLKAIMNFSQGQ